MIQLQSFIARQASSKLNCPVSSKVEVSHQGIGVSAHGEQSRVLDFERRVAQPGVNPKKSLGPILDFVDGTPFEEMLHLV